MVDAYLDGVSEQQLQGMAQKLASLELDAFRHVHGLTDHDPGARYDFGNPPERTDLQNFGDRKAMLEAIPDFSPCPGSKRCSGFPPFRRCSPSTGPSSRSPTKAVLLTLVPVLTARNGGIGMVGVPALGFYLLHAADRVIPAAWPAIPRFADGTSETSPDGDMVAAVGALLT